MTRFVGIDPGASGGVAWIDSDKIDYVAACRWPDDLPAAVALMQLALRDHARVAIEKVHAIPGTGSTSSAFAFGRSFGEILGIVATLAHDTERVWSWGLVPPQTWQKALGLGKMQGPERKRALKDVAMRRFSANAKLVTLKTCDALLIADWLRNGGVTQ